ncbi:hypothetical protein BOX15_Mlig013808g2 [Macrostomum lignano]|uniref:TOG domain-containing protein n=2 Tax=Macrostomum lignano TaxID=282301 RepID=A0A267DNC6_9PLAT|nr:hypothetical protein BOX15_Mlig013808g2 [Macrostomum lignano]
MEEVKSFLTSVKSKGASVQTREVLAVCEALTDNCIPDAALKAFFKHISPLSAHYPNGSRRRAALLKLFSRLQATHPAAVEHCRVFCSDLERFYTGPTPSPSHLRESVFSLHCLASALIAASQQQAVTIGTVRQALLSFAALLQGHYLAKRASLRVAFQRVAARLFQVPKLRALCLEFSTEQSPNPGIIAFCSMLAGFLYDRRLANEITDKSVLLKHYLQTCFVTKEAASQLQLDSSKRMVQLLVDRKLFSDEVLPLIKKAVLRSPEVALPTVSSCLSSLSVDLSQYSGDLLDTLSGHLRAESDALRSGSVDCVGCLAKQVTDGQAFVEGLTRRLCGLLLGNEAKLTNPKHKLSLLAACSQLPGAAPTDSARRSCSAMLGKALVSFLGQEVQEAITIEALCQLRLCLQKIDAKDLPIIVTALQDGLAKKQTQQQRLHYLWCLRSAFVDHPVSGLLSNLSALKDALTRVSAVGKPPAAALLLQAAAPLLEALAPCELTLRLHSEGAAPTDLFDAAMAACGKPHQPPLLSDTLARAIRLGGAAARCCLPSALAIVDALLSDYPSLPNEPMCAFLSSVATCANYADVRSDALRCARRHLQGLTGLSFARSLLLACNQLLVANAQSVAKASPSTTDAVADAGPAASASAADMGDALSRDATDASPDTAIALHDLMTAFADVGRVGDSAGPGDANSELPALLLLPCHHASVRTPNLWRRLLLKLFADTGANDVNASGAWQRMPLDLPALLNRCFDPLLSAPASPASSPQPHHRRAIVTLTMECPGFANLLASRILDCLTSPEVFEVTELEAGILRTPDNRVFDLAALDESANRIREELESSLLGGDSKAGSNVKRENRLYSYADQMAELELRRELASKKGDKELQKRLAAAMAEQLSAEKAVRDRLCGLDRRVDAAFQLLLGLIEAIGRTLTQGNSAEESLLLRHRLADCLSSLLAYPLTARRAIIAFEALATVAKASNSNGLIYARALFSLCSPAVGRIGAGCTIDWMSNNGGASSLVDSALYRLANADSIGENDSRQPLLDSRTEGDFAVALPLLRCVLLHSDGRDCQPKRCDLALTASERYCRLVSEPQRLPLNSFLPMLAGHLPAARPALLLLCERCGDRLTPECLRALMSCITGSEDPLAAQTALECLAGAQPLPLVKQDQQLRVDLLCHVHLARRHPDADVSARAVEVWRRQFVADSTSTPTANLSTALSEFHLRCLASPRAAIRQAAAVALAALAVKPDRNGAGAGGNEDDDGDAELAVLSPSELLRQLLDLYKDLAHRPAAEFDQFGRMTHDRPPDRWEGRSAVATALEQLLPKLTVLETKDLCSSLVESLLRDESDKVRSAMLKMGQKAVELHGRDCLTELVALFERFLETAPATAALDSVRQGVVVLLGQLARYLDAERDQARICKIFARLLDTLSIPSQSVQEAVSACLPPLMPAMRKDKEVIVEKLLLQALEADSYAQRKGAAYGLAGATKGLGIAVLKEIQVNQRLLDAMKDKKNPQRREGALLALEQICIVWGRLFEPYVVSILPSLLICCGDTVACVRQAADECSIAVMSKLSNHGVKLVLPSLLSTLAEDNWRTKCASVDLLGSMSYCAPKQLSACLPQIVPKLMEVLTDSHVRVQKAGEEALAKIGKVITNQEIRDIVPHLLDAIRDPDGHTNAALQQLLSVKFVHKIDTASLALIMPVLGRAFRDPATDTRKTAALIVGSMYRLTDRADLTPYMESLMPGLKKCLLDPVPDVRSVAAKALGSMVREMGETSFQDLFPWLMRTLVSEDSPINRAGAAQGLSEMIGGMGSAKLESLMPELINTAKQPDIAPHVRDGYLLMFVFLPRVFQTDFSQYVSATLPAILSGLANEIEFVRETALKAGQTLVQQYSKMAISLLLPELEVGLFDENWRIRYSSVQLLGDLLYKLSGASGKGTTVSANDDDTMGSSNEFARIGDQLGQERRNRVLAGLYVSRSDSALLVRQASCHVWKVVVPHTPRTLQAILPTLLPMLLGNLASASSDMREVSAKTLGDIVKKLGERVLQHMMQMLQTGLDSSDAKQREGVCLALSEIMRSVPKDHMQSYADQLVPTVRRALADPLPSVRVAASRTFDQLYTVLGQRALDDIVIKLQSDLEAGNVDDPDAALDGLKQAVAARSEVALPYLVPRLTQEPVNTRTLAILASVAGGALTPHLSRILPALLGALDPDSEDQMDQCRTVMHSVRDDAGVQLTIRHLTSSELSNQPLNYRLGAARLLHSLTQRDDSAEMLAEHTEAVLRACLRSYCIQDPRVIAAAHDCLAGLVSRCPTPSELVAPIRTAVRHVLSEPQHRATVTLVPGFCSLQPRGIQPLLNVYREGLLSGQVEQKEAAALGLKELIERTSPDALKSSVVAITGPLIRVLGDRFSAQLKCAVIDALTALLGRCGPGMKAFLPQLQLTLFKALADPAQTLRSRAALAIGQLASVHAKPDQMAAELLSALAKPDAYQTTLLSALRQWCLLAGRSLSPAACESVLNAVKSNKLCGAGADEETARACAGACVGLLAAACSAVTDTALGQFLLTAPPSGASDSAAWQEWQARLAGLAAYLGAAPADSVKERLGDIETAVLAAVGSDRPQVVDAGVRCIGLALAKAPQSERLVAGLVKAQKHENSDVKLLTSQAASFAIEALPDDQLLNCLAKPLLPMLANGTREKNIGVKAASEQALADACRLYRAERLTASCLDRLEPAMRDSVQQIVDRLAKKQWQRVPVCLDRTAAM